MQSELWNYEIFKICFGHHFEYFSDFPQFCVVQWWLQFSKKSEDFILSLDVNKTVWTDSFENENSAHGNEEECNSYYRRGKDWISYNLLSSKGKECSNWIVYTWYWIACGSRRFVSVCDSSVHSRGADTSLAGLVPWSGQINGVTIQARHIFQVHVEHGKSYVKHDEWIITNTNAL